MDLEFDRLRRHVATICTKFIWPQITAKGCILVRGDKGTVYEDEVSTHHLVDLLHTLNGNLFRASINNACGWFFENKASFSDPFFVTTLAQSGYFVGASDHKRVVDAILKQRRQSGLIEIFAGFLDGGSLFSTLWAVKILLLLQRKDELHAPIDAGLSAVRKRWGDLHRASFKGFYLELALMAGHQKTDSVCRNVKKEILGCQSNRGLWDDSILYSAYVAGNLLTYLETHPRATETKAAIDRYLHRALDLGKDADHMPPELKRAASTYTESAYLQALIRSMITAIRRLRLEAVEAAEDIAMNLLGSWPSLYNATGALDARLKHMLMQYGEIEQRFQKQENSARDLSKISPYEKNVFVMMPFRQGDDEQFKEIEVIIRSELRKKGFTAWLASDKDLDETLWGNITAFMTACKYGIAVFTRREDITKGTVEPEFNPNVSLELGFMVSRGKEVLLLKDIVLKTLPTDLMGHLYKQFDLRKVRRQLPAIVRRWAGEIAQKERKNEDAAQGESK